MSGRSGPRAGVEDLPGHLRDCHGVDVLACDEVDLGTYRIALPGDRAWFARVHPRERPLGEVRGDAEALAWLETAGYPSERIPAAVTDPVSLLHDQPVIVTEAVRPVARGHRRAAVVKAGGLRALGGRLAQLHTLDGAPDRAGGAWHHLADGPPSAELEAAREMLDDFGAPDALHAALSACDAGDGLPRAFVHPDFVMANVVCDADRDGALVFVDWSGAGQAPRIWPLAFLLWSLGAGGDLDRVSRGVDGYRRAGGELTGDELERLPAVAAARPVMFEIWAYATDRRSTRDAIVRADSARESARRIAERARAAFTT